MSGDGQQGEPGSLLAVQPRVQVKDAAGLVVPGASVTFAVDSGGGTLDASTAVTGTDGTASGGNWKLGAGEGRNVVRATVGAIAPAKFVASARIVPVTLPTQTVPSSGGVLTVTRAGSAIDGMTITFPSGSFAAPVDMQVSYQSSATLPVVTDMRVGSPMITIATTGAVASNEMYRIRIPVNVPDGEFPLVAIVNASTGFLDALTTVDYDANSVTALGWSLDESAHAEGTAASAVLWKLHAAFASAKASQNVQLAVLFVQKTKLHNLIVDTSFRPGNDDWEFDPATTPVYNGTTSSGAVVTERYYFRTKNSINNGSLWKRFQLATGAEGSNVAGMRWNKQISQDFDALVPRHASAAQAARAAGATKYDLNIIESIVASFIASKGAPQIVAFKNLNTGVISTVLAYKWDGPSGLLYDANPSLPGDVTRKSTWNAQGFQCTQSCLPIIGINHLISYKKKLDAEYPAVLDGTINRPIVPQAFASSHDAVIGQTQPNGIDTLFVADDTSRVWVECPTCTGQVSTTLPLKHGAAGIQTQKIYYELSSNAWTPHSAPQAANGFFFNVKTFPRANPNQWANFKLGIEGRGYSTNPVTPGSFGSWIGWKEYRVIKFAPTLDAKQVVPGVTATFVFGVNGGPSLPADGTYEFDWGDGIKTLLTSKPATLQHKYDNVGTYQVKLKATHKSGAGRIAAATFPVDVKHGYIQWRFETAVVTSSGPPLTGADGEDSLLYNSTVDALNKIRTNPGDASIISYSDRTNANAALQLVPPGTGGMQYGYVPTARFAFLAEAPNVFIGPFGNGVLKGQFNIFDDFTGKVGFTNTIDATMTPGFLMGTITLNSWAFAAAGPTFTLHFTAKFVDPF